MKKRIKLLAKDRQKANKAIDTFLKPIYFDSIPLLQLFGILEKFGLVVLQEDNTKWGGFLCGDSAETTFTIAYANTYHDEYFYIPIENAGLRLTWYKMTSGRYEIVSYIG